MIGLINLREILEESVYWSAGASWPDAGINDNVFCVHSGTIIAMQRVTRVSLWIFVGLLAYAPLHILLSTWIGTSFGVLSLMKVLKDVFMVWGLGLAFAAYINKHSLRKLYGDRLVLLIVAYSLLTLVIAVIKPTDQNAEILGIVFNLRFLAFFVYGLLLSELVDTKELRRSAVIAVLGSGFITLVFGVAQYLFLPNDALSHLGYARSNGVLPAFFIDDKPDLERIMSTQRDPNSFGSYVLILTGLAGALWMKGKRYRNLAQGFLGLCILCLWFTFSRSAWIGAVLTLAALAAFSPYKPRLSRKQGKLLIVGVFATVLCMAAGIALSWNTYVVQNVILHADQSTTLEDPNQLRIRFVKESVTKIVHNPLGSGPGTAGLASIRNTVQGTQLNEDYYLQIATEVGVVGLGLFVAILVVIGRRLYGLATKGDWLTVGLFASFVGLLFTNLLVHIWATEAVAYTWWGLAAVALGGTWSAKGKPAILKQTK